MLPVFSKRAKRALVSHGKFYFFDTGVYRTLRPKGPLDRPSEIDGAALEVDFIVYTPSTFLAIEVKNASRVDRSDFKGLKAFREDFPEARTVMLYRGEMQYEEDGVLVMPVSGFLEQGL